MCAFAVAQAVLEDAVVAIWLQEESFVGLCESGTSIVGLTATDVLTCGLDAFKGSDYSQKLSAFAEPPELNHPFYYRDLIDDQKKQINQLWGLKT